ncbi:MAG: hypothetical protein WCO63_10740 [Bacteroidota bacterium]
MQEEFEDYTPRQQRFLQQWEKHRDHRWRYILTRGGLMVGLPLGTVTYLWTEINFQFSLFNPWRLLIYIGIYILIGMLFGNSSFNTKEKNYKILKGFD